MYTSLFLDTDDLKVALRAQKLSGTFEKWASDHQIRGMHEKPKEQITFQTNT